MAATANGSDQATFPLPSFPSRSHHPCLASPISSSTSLSSIHLSVNPSNTASRALPFIISYTLYPSRQDGHPTRNITRQIGIPPAPKPISSHHPFLISSAGTFPRPVHSNKHAALSSHSPDPHPRLDTAHPCQRPVQQKLERRLWFPSFKRPSD